MNMNNTQLATAPDIAAFLATWLHNDLLQGEAATTFNSYYGAFRRNFSDRMRSYYAEQIREIEALVRASPNMRVLEVGCGLGTESLWLALKGAQVTALDVREDRIAGAQARLSVLQDQVDRPLHVEFSMQSILDLAEAQPFDAVWMEQAFHHLEPRSDVVAKIARLLKPGGHLVISEANALNPLIQAELLVRRGWPRVETMTGPDGKDILYGVERITTAHALGRAFAAHDIDRQSLRYFRMFPSAAVFDSLGGLERALAYRWLAPILTHFNWVGQKRQD
ncbi:MAG: class I SAM-dependent methyltransferase [Rhodospirillaceae bacterium]|nr:class I SAM-dependent methyltransferase [Rhodospirillaceae bacterium]MBT6986946.1 class I SAM-dependent methyltransferase [Rhodospirillaceae bacterium]